MHKPQFLPHQGLCFDTSFTEHCLFSNTISVQLSGMSKGCSCRVTPDPTQQLCEHHLPQQSPQSREGEVLFKWNKTQVTQSSPREQAGSYVCPEQDSYLSQEAWRFWAIFTPIQSFNWFRSSPVPSPVAGTSWTHSHKQ